MSNIVTIGLDIAKSVFQVHAVDSSGEVVVRRKLTRGRVLAFFESLPRCVIGIEACSSSHYWARELIALGHDVRLLPAQYVKPYSWRLNSSYHPRNDYAADVKAMPSNSLVLVGDKDEAVDSTALLDLLKASGYRGRAEVLAETTHFGIFHDAEALKRMTDFIATVPVP
ncbi:hypothetical protein KWJ32_25280 [Brucella sp. BTU2]|jgi:hypothetical protein|nr:hypothetical protein [Ochrobactrum sp. BTU2]|eukprot:jgi/Tetstr1/451751/TSEL_038787.t1